MGVRRDVGDGGWGRDGEVAGRGAGGLMTDIIFWCV